MLTGLRGSIETHELEKNHHVMRRTHSSTRPIARQESMMLRVVEGAGNLATQRLFKSGKIQPKLNVGRPDDSYEQEADRKSELVRRQSQRSGQRGCGDAFSRLRRAVVL